MVDFTWAQRIYNLQQTVCAFIFKLYIFKLWIIVNEAITSATPYETVPKFMQYIMELHYKDRMIAAIQKMSLQLRETVNNDIEEIYFKLVTVWHYEKF